MDWLLIKLTSKLAGRFTFVERSAATYSVDRCRKIVTVGDTDRVNDRNPAIGIVLKNLDCFGKQVLYGLGLNSTAVQNKIAFNNQEALKESQHG